MPPVPPPMAPPPMRQTLSTIGPWCSTRASNADSSRAVANRFQKLLLAQAPYRAVAEELLQLMNHPASDPATWKDC